VKGGSATARVAISAAAPSATSERAPTTFPDMHPASQRRGPGERSGSFSRSIRPMPVRRKSVRNWIARGLVAASILDIYRPALPSVQCPQLAPSASSRRCSNMASVGGTPDGRWTRPIPPLVWAFHCQAISERRSLFLAFLIGFFVRSRIPFLRPDPQYCKSRRAQELSRLAVAPTFPRDRQSRRS